MTLVFIILLITGTAALVFWNVLMFSANSENEEEIAHYAYRSNKAKIASLYERYNVDTAVLEHLDGFAFTWRKLWHDPKSSEKKAAKLQKKIDKLDAGNFDGINFFVLPGYAFLKWFNITGDKKFFIKTVSLYANLNGRGHAVRDTRYLLACMVSCAIGGIGVTAILGILLLALGESQNGLLLSLGGPLASVFLAFILYEDIRSKSRKRKDEIMSDFPQVVSEIALLTSSGMEMLRAWTEVCVDRNGALFREMRQTAAELDNGYEPSVAFESFVRRCGTKDTTRLGASILQNLTRGNAELSLYLTELSQEVWEERKHNARRLGEQAQSKLILPMGIIFIGILILIAVPVALGMGDMGF